MPRVKGAKNKSTILAEQYIADGMDPDKAKKKAKVEIAKQKKLAIKAAPTKTKKKTGRKKREYPRLVEDYNTTTKNAWWNAKKENPKSRKKAIRAMCLMCVGGSTKEAKECTADYCPLWAFRITG